MLRAAQTVFEACSVDGCQSGRESCRLQMNGGNCCSPLPYCANQTRRCWTEEDWEHFLEEHPWCNRMKENCDFQQQLSAFCCVRSCGSISAQCRSPRVFEVCRINSLSWRTLSNAFDRSMKTIDVDILWYVIFCDQPVVNCCKYQSKRSVHEHPFLKPYWSSWYAPILWKCASSSWCTIFSKTLASTHVSEIPR